jgi:2-polyprenyl-3-methyl-5-hydroxy-6-metoxy-1,4-benzoquinol methylase
MICYVCDADSWHSLGDINKARELRVCKSCGSAAYRVEPEEELKMRDFYRREYRPDPTIANLITTTHKQNYIKLFLTDFLKDKANLTVADIGCATGYLVSFFRNLGHRATGCEYTITYRRFAEHFYGIPVTEDLEKKHKYDLLSLYHVLEHMILPDKKLAEYTACLKDDGHFFVSTPEWLDTLEESSGGNIISFEHLFHKDHINVFTKTSLQNLFRRSALEVVKEDHVQYGQTYLLKRGEARGIVSENWETIAKQITDSKAAIDLFLAKKYADALTVWPKFPEAWMRVIFEDAMKDPDRQAATFEEAFKVLPDNNRLRLAYATWLYMRQDYERALPAFDAIMKVRPNEDVLMHMGWCFTHLGKGREAARCYLAASIMNPMKWAEAMDLACKATSSLKTWDELAVEKFKEELYAKSGAAPALRDPVMEPEPEAAPA